MKKRTGFVSNSSTTSFTVFGVSFTDEEIRDKIEDALYDKDRPDNWKNLDTHCGEGDDLYFGRSWDLLGDDETPKAFKARSEADIREVLTKAGVDVSKLVFAVFAESWYNG